MKPYSIASICAELETVARSEHALFRGGASHIENDDARHRALEPIYAAQEDLVARLVSLKATTPQEIDVVAKTIAVMFPDLLWDDKSSGPDERMIAFLLRSMVALATDRPS